METILNIESQDEFQIVLQEIVTNLYYTSNLSKTNIDSSLIEAAKDELKKIIFYSNFDVKRISDQLSVTGWSENKVEVFVNLFNEKITELLYTFLIKQNSEYGECISGFDWIVKLVLGTSELNVLKYPLLQLILSTVDSNGKQKKIMYDVSKDMLLKTIHALEDLEKT